MSWLSIRGLVRSSGGIAGSSYIMVTSLKRVMTCEYGKGPSWGLRLRYQFGSVVINIVIVSGCWVSFFVCGWAYPFLVHLCWNVVPIDPNTFV
jgi:hypothetical protein